MSSHTERTAYWSSLIAEQRSSGLTVPKFCLERNVSIHSFRGWRCQLNKAAFSGSGWATVKSVTAPTTEKSLTLRIGGASVDLSAGFDHHLLREIVTALTTC
jgi:hypothetical protein